MTLAELKKRFDRMYSTLDRANVDAFTKDQFYKDWIAIRREVEKLKFKVAEYEGV